ncbi:MAG: IS1595 family transposase [Chitinophagaceae bacterium]
MNSRTFFKKFPDEQSCKDHLKMIREQKGITCKNCKEKTKHWWLEKVEKFQCSKCNSRTNLKSGTIFQDSKIDLIKWFECIHYMTSSKKPVSCLEVQRQLEITRYEPVWDMMRKIRISMGEREDQYKLEGTIELDEGFFEVVNPKQEDLVVVHQNKGKQGRGCDKMKVLVMVESEPREQTKEYRDSREMGFVKMVVLEDLSSDGINYEVSQLIDRFSLVISDKSTSYTRLTDVVDYHVPSVIKKEDVMKKSPLGTQNDF